MEEIWKDLQNYRGIYQVSNMGRVRSLDRLDCIGRPRKGSIMKQHKDKDGYLRVCLTKNKKQTMHIVHRLVANEFIENPKQLPLINHMNEVKYDNRCENLEWCTHEHNNNFGTRNERLSKSHKGKIFSSKHRENISRSRRGKVYHSKIKRKDVALVKHLHDFGFTQKIIGEIFGVSQGCISSITRGVSFGDLSREQES